MKDSLSLLLSCCISLSAAAQEGWHLYHQNNSGLLSNRISSIANGHGQSLWVAYAGAGGEGIGVSHFDNLAWMHYDRTNSGLLNDDIRAIKTDNNGNTWFACYNAGLIKFDGNIWTTYTTQNSGIIGNNVSTLHIDSENNIWIGAYGSGISKFDGTVWVNYNADNSPFPDFNCINDLTTDSEGNLWVGIGCGGGLAMLNTQTNIWTSYNTSNSALQYYSVSAVIQDPTGKIWIGYPTNQNVISSFDNGTWVTYSPVESSFQGVAYDGFVIEAAGNILCAAMGNGLLTFDGTNWNQMVSDTANSSFSQSVVVDSQGTIWYAEDMRGIWTNGSIAGGAKDLVAKTVDASRISLAWSPPPSAPVEGYIVERKQSQETKFHPVDTLTVNDLAYVDTRLTEGERYDYRILAYNDHAPLQHSGISTATTNTRPKGSSFQKEVFENDTLLFSVEDFVSHFADADPEDVLANVSIKTLPESGQLMFHDVALTTRAIIDVNEIDQLAFVPDGMATAETSFSYFMHDGKDTSALAYDIVLLILPVNQAPVLTKPIADQQAIQLQSFVFKVDPLSFADPEGESLRHSATLSDGSALPSWITFEEGTLTFQGTPSKDDHSIIIRLTAIDQDGLSVSDDFAIEVDLVTGLEMEATNLIHAFPNPTSGVLFLDGAFTTIESISVRSATGRLLLHQEYTSDDTNPSIDLGHLGSGFYLVEVRRRGHVFRLKVLKDQ